MRTEDEHGASYDPEDPGDKPGSERMCMNNIRPEGEEKPRIVKEEASHAQPAITALGISEPDAAFGKLPLYKPTMLVRHKQHDILGTISSCLQSQQFREVAACSPNNAVTDVQNSHRKRSVPIEKGDAHEKESLSGSEISLIRHAPHPAEGAQ